MATPPTISVVIPTYNGERFLAQALDSVFSQLYRPLDVIVVDDGSTDASLRIAASYDEVRCFAQEHQNVSATRNRGVAEARGTLIAFLDQDDIWVPGKLAVQSEYLASHQEVGIVFGRLRNFLEPGEARPPVVTAEHRLGEWTQIMLGVALVRTEIFDRVGGFTTGRGLSSDFEWFARASGPACASQCFLRCCSCAGCTPGTRPTTPVASSARSCAPSGLWSMPSASAPALRRRGPLHEVIDQPPGNRDLRRDGR
jgi:glycosyltransferase involved in cell wall biosynthesis